MDTKGYVKQLVDSKVFTKAEAEAKVKAIVERVNAIMPDETDEVKANTVSMAIKKLTGSKLEKFVGVCIGMGAKRDQNEFAKKKAKDIYDQNPMLAVQDGYVAIVNGKPVYLDTREFIDAAKTMKNNNFKKALPETIQRQVFFLIDGIITRGFGNIDPQVGGEYEVFATKSKKGYLTIPKQPGIKLTKMIPPGDLYQMVYDAAGNSEFATDLGDVYDKEPGSQIISNGYVRFTKQTSGGSMLVIDDENTPDGVVCFSDGPEVASIIDQLDIGLEAIIMGTFSVGENKETHEIRKSVAVRVVITNPESAKYVSALKDMDDVLYG